jgi:hypothetical protein
VAGVGQDFTEGYTLSQGCAWCGVNAVFARFRFDGAGNFLGVSVQNVARDEDTEIPEPDPDDGMARRRTLRYKVGDVVQFKLRFAGDTWKLMDPVDAAVLRTVEAGPWGGIFCAGVCFGVESWIFEATGPGEVRLVFKNAPPKGAVVPPEMTVEYLIEVE